MEHSGELVLNRARNAKLVQSPSLAHDITWFTKTLTSLCKALVYAGVMFGLKLQGFWYSCPELKGFSLAQRSC